MKAAVLFYIPTTTSSAVCWRWHSVDGKTDSAQPFPSYDDCLADARASGYFVEATRPRADPAPSMRRTFRKLRLSATASRDKNE
jgi:hypothetical protein